jgi:Xaa-Pro aminopeptidase
MDISILQKSGSSHYVTPDWGEYTLSNRPGETTSLQTDMTIHVMPGIWPVDH